MPQLADRLAPPRRAAPLAAPLRAAGQNRPLHQRLGKDGVMRAAIGSGREPPDIARVLAERMPDPTLSVESVEPAVTAAGDSPVGWDRPGALRRRRLLLRLVRNANGVEVEEVVALPHE